MIEKIVFCKSEGYYPYLNQAIEEELTKYAEKGVFVMFLWANDKTVFIGKNQNAFTECNVPFIKEHNGFIARRFTGGGAVYHDKGNLNFTFIAPAEDYDLSVNFSIMLDAIKSLGLNAEISGRNDILVSGRKFSGNAFFQCKQFGLHHGTVLINTDPAAIRDYLNVADVKLNSKGVKSVASRVINLSELDPNINSSAVASAIEEAVKRRFGGAEFCRITQSQLDQQSLARRTAKFSDQKYIMGDDVFYDMRFLRRFDWGVADIRVKSNGDKIEKIKIYSDSLDTTLAERQTQALTGADIRDYSGDYADIVAAIKEERCTTL